MRLRSIAALCVATSFALGCADEATHEVVAPNGSLRFGQSTGLPCDAATNRLIKSQQSDLFAQADLKTAQTYWDAVVAGCSTTDPNAANGPLMIYVNYIRGLYPASVLTPKSGGTKEDAFLLHINTIFPYVGYPAPNVPNGATGPLAGGLFGVILGQGGARELALLGFGAITLDEQNATGDQRGHLFVMYSTGSSCLTVDNLAKLGTCVEVQAFPSVSPQFSPKIKVGVCVPNGGLARALAHETASGTEIAGSLSYPASCHPVASTGSWTGGFGEVMKRLAWIGREAIGVNTAYASHSGLGGIGGGISPFGGLDAQIFAATFDSDAVGQPPANHGNFTFTDSVSAPGTILVQSSLGDRLSPLVVLSQAGGNCTSCGGLLLQANLFSASNVPADDGVYEVNWVSVQAAPSVKGAPFVLRDAQDRELARLTYKTTPAGNQLFYNETILVGTWARNVSQSFRILVNLNANTTTLQINGITAANAKNLLFVNPAVTSFDRVAADFRGIDSGIMGWDDIGIRRISDN